MNSKAAVEVINVSKKYRLYRSKKHRAIEALLPQINKYHTDFYSLKDINLTINKGETVGIIGKNGSGKSTLMKLIAGVTMPSSGTIKVNGNLVPLLELGSGFHPEFTGYENIYFYTAILGYPKEKIKTKIEEIVEFADVGEFIDQPVKNYSSGMRSRLSFAVSVNIDPDILILDEVLSVGDAAFKVKSYEKIQEFFTKGKTIFSFSHSMESVKKLCSRAILIDQGELVMDGDPESVTSAYLEKYAIQKRNPAKQKAK